MIDEQKAERRSLRQLAAEALNLSEKARDVLTGVSDEVKVVRWCWMCVVQDVHVVPCKVESPDSDEVVSG